MNSEAPETERQDGSDALPRNQDYPRLISTAQDEQTENERTHRDPATFPVVLCDLRNSQSRISTSSLPRAGRSRGSGCLGCGGVISVRWGARCDSLVAEETGMLDSGRAPAGTQPFIGSWMFIGWVVGGVSRRTNHHPGAGERTRSVSYLGTKLNRSAGGRREEEERLTEQRLARQRPLPSMGR